MRDYNGVLNILKKQLQLSEHQHIFFEARTAKYRGDFLGFIESLSIEQHVEPVGKAIFFKPIKEGFSSLSHFNKLMMTKKHIFFEEDPNHAR